MKLHLTSMGLLAAALTLVSTPATFAQQNTAGTEGPPKYIYLSNIELKPQQGGAFAKTEAEEVQALRAANAPQHYFGMWSITGGSHVLYFSAFDSFADLQKNHHATMAMSTLMDKLRADGTSEAPLIATKYASIYRYDKDLSLRPDVDISKMRFMRIVLFHVRRGHAQDFEHTAKLFAKAYETAIPEASWAMFQKMYGEGSDSTYILVTPMTSLATIDDMQANGKKFMSSVGPDQLQVLREQLSKDVKSSESDLFAFDASISYAPDSWIKASPDFWGKK